MGMHLMGVHLMGMHLMDMYLMSMHLMGVYFISMHLIGVYLMAYFCMSSYQLRYCLKSVLLAPSFLVLFARHIVVTHWPYPHSGEIVASQTTRLSPKYPKDSRPL